MADNTFVRPSTDTGRIEVRTDVIEDIHYPVFKGAFGEDGEVSLVSGNSPLPVSGGKLETLLSDLVTELRILNAYNALGHDEVITEDDLESR